MKKYAIAFIIFASSLAAQVQLGKNVQIGASGATGTVTEVDTNTTSGISGGPITLTGTVACEQGSATQFGCVKADGTTITASGGVLTATGAGGSGVQYNPTTTGYLVTSFSGLYDDSNASASIDLGIPTSVSCVHTTTSTCTVVTAAPHGLSIGGAIDMSSLTSWPVAPGGVVQQSAQYGSFQVTTVPNSTTITFTTPTALTYTCSPCTGHVWDASQWGIWIFAREPYIYGHGTVFGLETETTSLATNWSTLTSQVTGSGATPIFLIDQSGVNDLAAGRTVTQVENDHLSVYALAHTAGMKVMQTTLLPSQTGLTNLGDDLSQINVFFYKTYQSKTPTQLANGQYIDYYVDTASPYIATAISAKPPSYASNRLWGDTVNPSFSMQGPNPIAPPTVGSWNNGSGADAVTRWMSRSDLWYDANWNNFLVVNIGGSGNFTGLSIVANNNTTNWFSYNPSQAIGFGWRSDSFGVDSGNLNTYNRGFYYAGANSTSNSESEYFWNAPLSNVVHYADGTTSFPGSTGSTPSTSPVCPNGHNGTLTTTGCTSGSSGAVTNITGSSQVTITGCTQSASTGGQCVVTGSTSPSIAISSIPGTYIDLEITVFGTTSASTTAGVKVNFNSDTGTNYDSEVLYSNSGTGPSHASANGATSAVLCDLGYNGSYIGGGKMLIPQYANTSFIKMGVCNTVADGPTPAFLAGLQRSMAWHSTAAITAITLTPETGSFNIGDTIVIRGVN